MLHTHSKSFIGSNKFILIPCQLQAHKQNKDKTTPKYDSSWTPTHLKWEANTEKWNTLLNHYCM